jgi:aminoglycoside 3-N-acetyltransferase
MTKDELRRDLSALGLSAGDVVFFHSSLKSIGYVEGGADAVIDAFLEMLGPSGTLALPALCKYDWDRLGRDGAERAWDIHATPTFTGIIPETFRRRPGVLRSDNPTHSVTAFGAHALEITKDHRKAHGGETAVDRPIWASRGAFGEGSPWDKLYRLDAKCLLIGVDFSVCTLLHHVQVLLLEHHARAIGGNTAWPDLDFNRMGAKLEALGLVRIGRIGQAPCRCIGCRCLVDTSIRLFTQEAAESC